MARTAPEPIDPKKVPELARAVIRAGKFPLLATADGDQPRVRPMTLSWEEDFTTYYVSLRRFHKTVELDANPKVEVCFLDEHHSQVRISGTAELVTDAALRQRAWDRDPLIPRFLGSIDNPEFMLWRVRPQRVRYMKEWALEYHDVPVPSSAA
jgi:general stress protein 26